MARGAFSHVGNLHRKVGLHNARSNERHRESSSLCLLARMAHVTAPLHDAKIVGGSWGIP
mgnify:CR=1 FL=1